MICISCHTEHHENFCPNCGERAGVKKISFRSTMEDAFATLTDMDKGFLFNIKAMVVNPQKLIIDYLMGKRKGILNPISFLIISISIYLVLEAIFKTPTNIEVPNSQNILFNEGYTIGKAAGLFIKSYYKYFLIFTIFLLANSTKITYQKFNYLEHVAISSFVIGFAILVSIIPFLLINFPLLFNPVYYIILLVMIYRIFKNTHNKSDSLILLFTSLLLFIIQLFLVIFIVGLIMNYKSW